MFGDTKYLEFVLLLVTSYHLFSFILHLSEFCTSYAIVHQRFWLRHV